MPVGHIEMALLAFSIIPHICCAPETDRTIVSTHLALRTFRWCSRGFPSILLIFSKLLNSLIFLERSKDISAYTSDTRQMSSLRQWGWYNFLSIVSFLRFIWAYYLLGSMLLLGSLLLRWLWRCMCRSGNWCLWCGDWKSVAFFSFWMRTFCMRWVSIS